MNKSMLHIRIRSIPNSDKKEWGIFDTNLPGHKASPINGWWFISNRLAMATMRMWIGE